MTFKEIIAEKLLEVCLAETEKHRIVPAEKKAIRTNPDVSEEQIFYLKINFENEHKKLWAIALGDDRMLQVADDDTGMKTWSPFTVIVAGINRTNWRGTIGKPYILTLPKNGYYFMDEGSIQSNTMSEKSDQVSLASPSQITECIASLNDSQWATIMKENLFSPIIKAALEMEVEPFVQV